MQKRVDLLSWFIFILLSVIWGASFKLIKLGLGSLSPYQVAAIRLLSAGLVLLPFALRALREVPRKMLVTVILSGIFGSFIPAFLFCIAETKIDSSLAGMLNALTPIFTVLIGVLAFGNHIKRGRVIGILIGFAGTVLCLYFKANGIIRLQYVQYSLLVVLATIFYGINVNMVGRYLGQVGSLRIAALAFTALIPFSLGILLFTGYFNLPLGNRDVLISTASAVVLGVMGTAIASIMFYMLLKRAGVFFSSLVTYGIPVVAILIGFFGAEFISWQQLASLSLILLGVYLAGRKEREEKF
jgi:drug/metabolite transporter (DMT)-like permease